MERTDLEIWTIKNREHQDSSEYRNRKVIRDSGQQHSQGPEEMMKAISWINGKQLIRPVSLFWIFDTIIAKL
jgi:hypothetical protein